MVGHSFAGEFEADFSGPSPPLRQGDVLQLIPTAGAGEWDSHYGILVTANCDLVHGKSGGVVTYVPVVPIEVYVKTFILPAEVRRQRDRSLGRLTEVLEAHDLSVSVIRIEEMLALGENPKAIAAAVTGDSPLAEHVEIAVRRVAACADAETKVTQGDNFQSAMASLVILRSAINALETNPSKKPAAQLVRADVANCMRSMPSDTFYLGSISPTSSHGYIAYLRLLREISFEHVATTPREERLAPHRNFRARRISRLQLIYTHKLLQTMASVFTDIGLPEEYETRRRLSMEDRIAAWLPFNTP